MAGHTTNINLEKPTYSEDADIAVINSNMDIIDGKMGAVGSTSVQAQLNTASTNITNLGKELCAVVAGKQSTTGAATGEYVIVRGSTISGISDGAYIAAKTIPANTNLDSSYFSSTGMTKGIANSLNANLNKVGLAHSLGGIASMSALVSAIQSYISSSNGANQISFYASASQDYWTINATYSGFITGGSTSWTAIVSDTVGNIISVGTYNGGSTYNYTSIKELKNEIKSNQGGVPIRKAGNVTNGQSFTVSLASDYSANAEFALVSLNISGNALSGMALLVLGRGTSKVKDLIGSMDKSAYSTSYDNGTWTITNSSGNTIFYTAVITK